MKPMKPNLFSYATSELSQDAVICWMLHWVNYNDSKLKSFAVDFINEMINGHHKDLNLSAEGIEKLETQRQYKNIDIVAKIYFKTKDVLYLIIEDKINSIEHGDQLRRYYHMIESETKKQECPLRIHGVYYKTGLLYNKERDVAQNNRYQIINKDIMIKLMDKYINNLESDIFIDYYDHLKQLKKKEEKLVKVIDNNNMNEKDAIFDSAEGQWILASKIVEIINNVVDFYNGTNRGGHPWTQIKINKEFYNHTLPDAIFYRIDRRNAGCYIALRQYLNIDSKKCKDFLKTEDVSKILEDKEGRLERLKSCFLNAKENLRSKDYYIEPGRVSKRGKKENEIGVFIINQDNDFKKILKFIPEFNEIFCNELKKEFDKSLFTHKAVNNSY